MVPDRPDQSKTFKFSDAKLRGLEPEAERYECKDTEVPGLQIRVTPNGVKTFCVFRRVAGGNPVRATIGRFGAPWNVDDARKKAKQIMSELADSKDPTEAKRRLKEELTLSELFDLYKADRIKAGKRSVDDMSAQFERYLGKVPDLAAKKHGRKRKKPDGGVDWSAKRLSEITPEAVNTLHSRIVQLGKSTTANRVHEILRAMFGYAIKHGHIKDNPAENVTPAKENEITRHLSGEEIHVFMAALEQEQQPWRDYFTLLLFIGYRRSAVASMQWVDVDLERGAWRVRGEFAKNGDPIVLPIIGQALEILARRSEERDKENPWVFPGDGADGHITSPEKAWDRVITRSGIKERLRLHDLRHTLASWMINNGVTSLPAIGRVLGHKDARSTQRYAHLIIETAADAVSKAHDAIQSTVKDKKVHALLQDGKVA